MAFLLNDDVTSGTGTTTGSALTEQVGASAGNDRLFVVMAHNGDPGTITKPASWGTVYQFQVNTGSLYLTVIVTEDTSASGGNGTAHSFSWTNSRTFVAILDGVQGQGWDFVTNPSNEGSDSGSGGPASWNLPDRTFNFTEASETAPQGVHVISPRAYLRTAGTGTFASFAPTGNGTQTGGFSTGSGLLGLSLNQFVRESQASLSTGLRGISWNSTGSGVGIQMVTKIGLLTDSPPVVEAVSPLPRKRRHVLIQELPYILTDNKLMRGRLNAKP